MPLFLRLCITVCVVMFCDGIAVADVGVSARLLMTKRKYDSLRRLARGLLIVHLLVTSQPVGVTVETLEEVVLLLQVATVGC